MADELGQLVMIMHEELSLHQNLGDTLQAKLQAMRSHDTAGLEAIAVSDPTHGRPHKDEHQADYEISYRQHSGPYI